MMQHAVGHTTTPAAASFGHELSIDLAAPPEAVWRVIADYERDAEWRERVRMTVEPRGEVRLGTTTREDLKMLGEWHHTVAKIREVEPGRYFRFATDDGRVDGSRRIEPHGTGSRVTLQIRVAVPGAMGLFAPLLGWMFRTRVQRDLKRLERLVSAR